MITGYLNSWVIWAIYNNQQSIAKSLPNIGSLIYDKIYNVSQISILQKIDLQTQIIFEYHLEQYNNSLGNPLKQCFVSFTFGPLCPALPITSNSSQFHRYCRSSTFKPSSATSSLTIILNESPKSILLYEFYKKNWNIWRKQRISVLSTIALVWLIVEKFSNETLLNFDHFEFITYLFNWLENPDNLVSFSIIFDQCTFRQVCAKHLYLDVIIVLPINKTGSGKVYRAQFTVNYSLRA